VSSEESLQKGFADLKKDFNGNLDICVPCAGINRNLSFLDTGFEEHQKLINVNVVGVYHTAQFAAKQMIANGTRKGSIILVASIASYMAIRSQMSSAYCGTKGAVRAMCPAIAAELVQHVGLSQPGFQKTNNDPETGHQSQLYLAWICENRDDSSGKFQVHLRPTRADDPTVPGTSRKLEG
jgi:NAD(P)-dependent dehydrogenase (short-subunit alcohol dehydrogenase family)